MAGAGGGPGGHLYPGIAVARELMDRQPEARVTFAGTASGIEARVLPREGLPLDLIRSAGLKGKSVQSIARGVAPERIHVVMNSADGRLFDAARHERGNDHPDRPPGYGLSELPLPAAVS